MQWPHIKNVSFIEINSIHKRPKPFNDEHRNRSKIHPKNSILQKGTAMKSIETVRTLCVYTAENVGHNTHINEHTHIVHNSA